MNEILFVVEEAEDGSYRANAVGQAIHTEADSLNELHQEIRDAVHCHFDEGQAPPLIRLHHVRQELLTLCESPGISTELIWPSSLDSLATASPDRAAATCGSLGLMEARNNTSPFRPTSHCGLVRSGKSSKMWPITRTKHWSWFSRRLVEHVAFIRQLEFIL